MSDFISETVKDRDLVHLVISADKDVDDDVDDDVNELPAFQRTSPAVFSLIHFLSPLLSPGYEKIVRTRGPSPNIAAESTEYSKLQDDSATAIHDGRLSRVAPPLEIFHFVFRLFTRLLRDASHQPLQSDIMGVQELFQYNRVVVPEETRNAELLPIFARLLGCAIGTYSNPDGTAPDGMYTISIDGMTLPALVIELKNELGDGECDPSTQAGHSMRRAWIQDDVRVLNASLYQPGYFLSFLGPKARSGKMLLPNVPFGRRGPMDHGHGCRHDRQGNRATAHGHAVVGRFIH